MGEGKLFAYVRNAMAATFDFREVKQRRPRRLRKRHFLNTEFALIQRRQRNVQKRRDACAEFCQPNLLLFAVLVDVTVIVA